MAPEQWSDAAEVGPAADIYSLGIIAYQALRGDVPFTADTSNEYYRQNRYAEVPPLGFGVPIEVEHVIQTALAKYPGGRQKSVLKLASDMRRALRQSRREQLRSSAQQWDDQGRVDGFLWGPNVLGDVTREIPLEDLGELDQSFIVESLRRDAAPAPRTRCSKVAIPTA
jgi:serine/threonine protein kinase